MTAEVVVMNRKGVAMAADSAGTLSSRGMLKIYNSNDKLFQVSDKCHIGTLTYGNSSINGAPFELIIGRFKEQHRDTIWGKVDDCKADFIEYLNSKEFGMYSDEKFYIQSIIIDSLEILRDYFNSIKDDIRHLRFLDWQLSRHGSELNEEEKDQFSSDRKNIKERLDNFNESNYIEWNLEQITQLKNCCNINDSFFQEIYDTYSSYIADELEKGLEQLQFVIPPEKKNLVIRYCIYAMFKNILREGGSGVAFAGFGSEEFYPSCANIEIYGVICGKTIYQDLGGFTISTEKPMYIMPLAQKENVNTFVFGISPMMEKSLRESVGDFFGNALSKFGHELSDEDAFAPFGKEKLLKALTLARESMEKEFTELLDFTKFDNRQKIYTALDWLSIPDMAQMAKNLIELTTFKKKMSVEADTVGGPIDVAVISKNDGFTWVEKKTK